MISEEQIIGLLKSCSILPILSEQTQALEIPYVVGSYAKDARGGGFINRVGSFQIPVEHIDSSIQAVINYFGARNQSFDWFSTSADGSGQLNDHLNKWGFTPVVTLSGMVLTDLNQDFPMRDDVIVQLVEPDERHLVSRIYQAGFPMDKLSADLLADMIALPHMNHYLVYLEGVDEPVGAATGLYDEEHQALILEVATILEAYRGQGIYNSLIVPRLHKAHADGMKLALVQASISTSATALRKLGFVEKIIIDIWTPPS